MEQIVMITDKLPLLTSVSYAKLDFKLGYFHMEYNVKNRTKNLKESSEI